MVTNLLMMSHVDSRSPFKSFVAVLTCVMLFAFQLMTPEPAYAKPTRAPELVADEFYGWYLDTLAADEDPLTDHREKLSFYVAKSLITDIERQINSADGISEDYFLKSQDYLVEWQSTRRASTPIRIGSTRVVEIALGSTTKGKHILELSMVRESGVWKIRQVRAKNTMKH